MKIILANGVEKNAILVTGGQIYAQGANRDALTFVFSSNEVSLDEIDNDFTPIACENIKLVDETGSEFIHKGYTIRTELTKKDVVLTPGDETNPETVENRIMVTMAQRTYVETQMASLIDTVDVLVLEKLMGEM